MAVVIRLDNLRDGYIDLVKQVLADGVKVSPRGMETLEIQDAIIELRNPLDAIPMT